MVLPVAEFFVKTTICFWPLLIPFLGVTVSKIGLSEAPASTDLKYENRPLSTAIMASYTRFLAPSYKYFAPGYVDSLQGLGPIWASHWNLGLNVDLL